MGFLTTRYRMNGDKLESKIFDSEELPETGWFHDPFAAMEGEKEIPPETLADLMKPDDEREKLVAEYERRFGEKPHHKLKAESIQKKLDELDIVQASVG